MAPAHIDADTDRATREAFDPMIEPWHHRRALPACSGTCEQGRRPCPHPDACELAVEEPDGPPLDRTGAFFLVLCILGAWAAVLGLVQLVRWLWSIWGAA